MPNATIRALVNLGALVLGPLVVGCGGGGGSSPPAPSPPPPPPTWAIGGRVTAAITGEGVGGVRLIAGPLEAWTDADGRFAFRGEGASGVLGVTVQHPGFVERQTRLRWAQTRDDAVVDVIRDAAPFSRTFYRELVRNAKEAPEEIEPLRRPVTAPSWFLRTVTEDTAEPVPDVDLDRVEATLRAVLPVWTSGAFDSPVVERGATPPIGPGRVIVRFRREPEDGGMYCGRAFVGANPGQIELILRPTTVFCCTTTWTATSVMAHEVGHALGFWHVGGPRSEHLMAIEGRSCARDTSVPSETERFHARIAYTRPPGNLDPDVDPATITPLRDAGVVEVRCGS